MKYLVTRILFMLGVLNIAIACATANTANRHFWEISAPDLDYPAMIREDPRHGTTVVYNTRFCEQDPDACGFFRAHAHAHSALAHQILPPDSYTPSRIAAADCWAARNSSPSEVAAAVDFLEDENRDPDITIVGDPAERAKHIRECAEKAGNWTGRK